MVRSFVKKLPRLAVASPETGGALFHVLDGILAGCSTRANDPSDSPGGSLSDSRRIVMKLSRAQRLRGNGLTSTIERLVDNLTPRGGGVLPEDPFYVRDGRWGSATGGVLGEGDTSGDTWPLCVPTDGEPHEFWRDFEAEGWRMAVVLKASAKKRPEFRVPDRRDRL